MSVAKKLQEGGLILSALGVLGFIGVVWLMIYGNLSGNLGFAVGTTNYNLTQGVINNQTGGFSTFFGFSNTLFTIGAIVLLIFMLVGLLAVVMKIAKGFGGGSEGGFSGY